jgi:hypothetical protein
MFGSEHTDTIYADRRGAYVSVVTEMTKRNDGQPFATIAADLSFTYHNSETKWPRWFGIEAFTQTKPC